MSIDWEAIEEKLFSLSVEHLRKFAENHSAEVFYGFSFTCGSIYGDVLMQMNTPELLRSTAEHYLIEWSQKHPERTLADWEDELRWSLGDWGYFEIADSEEWDREWGKNSSEIDEAVMAQPESAWESTDKAAIPELFMRMVCRVLIKMEDWNLFDQFQKTEDFRTTCIDHNETLAEGDERLNYMRGGGSFYDW